MTATECPTATRSAIGPDNVIQFEGARWSKMEDVVAVAVTVDNGSVCYFLT